MWRGVMECDKKNVSHPRNSPLGLLVLWARHLLKCGPRDIATRLFLDLSSELHAPLRPALVARVVHHVRMDFGQKTIYPRSVFVLGLGERLMHSVNGQISAPGSAGGIADLRIHSLHPTQRRAQRASASGAIFGCGAMRARKFLPSTASPPL